MFLTLILISTLAEGVTDTNKLSFFLTIHEKYSWYRNQSSQPLPSDFAIRVYSPDIITFLLSLWIFGKYKNLQTFSVDLKNIKRFMLIYMYIKRMYKSYRWWITVVSHLRVTSGQLIFSGNFCNRLRFSNHQFDSHRVFLKLVVNKIYRYIV